MPTNTDWLHDAKWGVFIHYLAAAPSSDGGGETSAEAWNAQVDAFDVDGLTRQLVSVGAPYFFITIGQNSGHYCSPNATYDRYVGVEPSKCSRRDLVAELYEALEPHGIRLMVYLPSGAPAADPVAMRKLGWRWGYKGDGPTSHSGERTGERLAEFQVRWEAIIREWSLRWGRRVHGWWIDGCYFADEMYRSPDAPNFASFAAAMKAGNPDSIVAFNPGALGHVLCHTEHEDYTAGEVMYSLPTVSSRWVERAYADASGEEKTHRAQLQVLIHLGERWGGGAVRFPRELTIAYSRYIAGHDGAITWEVPVERSGLIEPAFVDELKAVGEALGG